MRGGMPLMIVRQEAVQSHLGLARANRPFAISYEHDDSTSVLNC
jgi:hypothetical protein